MANAKNGSQLLTEWNMLSRSSVGNHSSISYICGPSYTHSLNDFKISAQSATVIAISGGQALVHGHFLYSENTITVDLTSTSFSGRLCIGLIAMYANAGTISASIDASDSSGYYKGIQVVILPKSQFKLPEDGGNPTAHLKLGEFTYQNQTISNLVENTDRIQVVDADKIGNLSSVLDDTYVKKTGLDPQKLYLMDGSTANWEDATSTAMIWDANPSTIQDTDDTFKSIWLKDVNSGTQFLEDAAFRYDDESDQMKLVVPHKQPQNMPTSTAGVSRRYIPKEIVLPSANRATGDGGVLDRSWVNFINNLDNKIATMYRMPGGKMRRFIDVLTSRDDLPAPPIAYYTEQTRNASYYDTRLQYSFNLLQTQVAQLNDQFQAFQSNVESTWRSGIESDIKSDLEPTTQATAEQVNDVVAKVSEFQGNIASIASKMSDTSAAIQSQITAYESLASLMDESINTLKDRVSVLENRWTPPSDSSNSGGSVATPTDDDIEKLQKQIDQINTTITSLNASLSTLKTTISSVEVSATQSAGNSAELVSSLNTKLYGSNGDVSNLVTAVEQLRSQYDYLYDAIHDLYDGINSEVEKSTDSLKSKILSELKKDIDAQIAVIADQYGVSADWAPGDYVLVAQDHTVATDVADGTGYPSTMYIVVPGKTILNSENVASYYDVYETELSTPKSPVSGSSSTSDASIFNQAMDTYKTSVDTIKRYVPARFLHGYELGGNDVEDLDSEASLPDVYNSTVMLERLYDSPIMIRGVRGTPGKDYFVLRYRYPIDDVVTDNPTYTDEISGASYTGIAYQRYKWVSVFFTLNLTTDSIELDKDNPVVLSTGTPYAEEERVGGFLNVGSDVYGSGYVSRDEEGHLRLNDFNLLAAGVSAYQLGEDRTEGSGLDISELQDVFDQYINQRIAFPNDSQLYKASQKGIRTDVITIELNISSSSSGVLTISDIDSRFNTSVHLKISGGATENAVLNIKNCQRLRITLDDISNPTIFLDNVCLYYDADVIDHISNISGLSLWYQKYDTSDPDIEIDGMTVIYQGRLEPKGTEQYWNNASGNDNNYAYALRQITFANDGTIIGMGVAVTDNTTSNMTTGDAIFASTFLLPQSIGLSYPVTRLTKQIKVTGTFTTAYRSTAASTAFMVKNTNFSMLTQKYLKYTDVREAISGVISFYTHSVSISDTTCIDGNTLMNLAGDFAIDGWEPGAYHIFYGGAVE